MQIGVVGAGHVGLIIAAGFADFGMQVVCTDKKKELIDCLNKGVAPFHEPGLQDIISRNLNAGRLTFTADTFSAIHSADVIFIAVGTDGREDGSVDLGPLYEVTTEIAVCMQEYKVIVIKSTVPVGTAASVRALIRDRQTSSVPFDVVSNPEFLREGSALETFLRPERVVLGTESSHALAIMRRIYRPLYLIETPIIATTNETAELIKYASNAFLSMKISFINEIANLSDALGCDVHVVAKVIGLDRRIGSKFLHPGPGYGGSCFPKDTKALLRIAELQGIPMDLLRANIQTNESQPRYVVQKIRNRLGKLTGKTIAILGLSYKPNTDDVRQSPAISVCKLLLENGAILKVHDPVANELALQYLDKSKVQFCASAYDAATDADGVVVLTEWNEFRNLDLARLNSQMAGKYLFDIRNIYDPNEATKIGFEYEGMGRTCVARRFSPEAQDEILMTISMGD